MKVFWYGVATLLLLLGVCLGITGQIERTHKPVACLLEEAAIAGARENWAEARDLVSQAHQKWTKNRSFTASVADHTPMEEIDSLFSRLPVLAAARVPADFSAACRELARKADAMVEAHSWAWENLL